MVLDFMNSAYLYIAGAATAVFVRCNLRIFSCGLLSAAESRDYQISKSRP